MRNKLIYISILITVVVLLFVFKNKDWRDLNFECHANLRLTTETINGDVSSNMFLNIIPEVGYLTISGSANINDKAYVIHRDVYIKRDKENNSSKILIEKEIILPGDSMDNHIWFEYFSPRPIGVPFYTEIRHVRENLYLFSLPSSPIFVCAKTKQ